MAAKKLSKKKRASSRKAPGTARTKTAQPASGRGGRTSKRKSGGDDLDLRLEATEDILALLGREKDSRVHAGFALETEDHLANARGKLEAKNLDWIVVNDAAAIGRESGDYHILGADGSEHPLGRLDKRKLASQLLNRIEASATGS